MVTQPGKFNFVLYVWDLITMFGSGDDGLKRSIVYFSLRSS
jgi:hypothetical protein